MYIKHVKFGYNSATQLASHVIELFYGLGNSFGFSFDEFWKENQEELIKKMIKPHKDTALHSFIRYVDSFVDNDIYEALGNLSLNNYQEYLEYVEAMIRGTGYDLKIKPPDYDVIAECGNCEKCPDCTQLNSYIEELDLAKEDTLSIVVDTTFHLLMLNKTFLREFNEQLAECLEEDSEYLKKTYQTDFDKNGKINRAQYWPKWLKRGLFYRDRGVCVICRTDLSGTLNVGLDYEIDHIVPISKYGNNDPSNLQILCSKCNLKKLNTSNQTSNYEIPFWNTNDD